MLAFVWNLGAFIVALGILVTVHEFGHFWVARRCGVKVERFSIGFGKAIWRRTGADGTEYVVAMIPLGGYVKMLDGRVDDLAPEMASQAFDRKPVWQRIAVVSAGPLANFAFALVALYAMYLVGVPAVRPVLDNPAPQSIAEQAGLEPKSLITSVAGQEVLDWEAVNLALLGQLGQERIALTVETPGGGLRDVSLNTASWKVNPETQSILASLGLVPWSPKATDTLAFVDESGAAYAAGVRQGDRLIALGDQPYQDWDELVAMVQAHADKPLAIEVEREGERLSYTMVPKGELENGQLVGKIGVAPGREDWPEAYRIDLKYGAFDALVKGAERTWELTALTLKMIGNLFTGEVSVKSLSGPISIAQGAGATAGFGLVYFLGFLALISVNLGIINLLPLPVLDGGHLLYYFIELLTGRPVPERVQEIGFRIGSALLLLLMSIAIVNDVARL
ncbi:sigma E protease regulator RseP [Ferrimonas balearica]|uniref:sigma E protease regulator RseP n=1 Tax=Ferrimonas balearica TaxID=44012 RepID=UPI001C585542|nr:sigma E protease regulator RseP [Ferrimonas balearica]MBW3164369.1 sigma E protease regulator RseP [Ferrimonas balearica]MBY6105142.1 sigma E protease regulator RseP [Ferrimonas balearica]MBY6224992.1 sigma E protease regulator RseP [Ferrimonas balearica]